jgi:ABC-type dipeptide/oligopeptide/nickel transport system permease component
MNELEYFKYVTFPVAVICSIIATIAGVKYAYSNWNNKEVDSVELFMIILSGLPAFFIGYVFSYAWPVVLIIGSPILIIKYLRK